jgi:hypothetical protein
MSKCPVDHQRITAFLIKCNKMFELPWTPLYTQSGGSPEQGEEAFSPLAYWSLAATIGFTVLVYTFEGNLDARQKAAYQKTTFPKELQLTVSKIDEDRKKEKNDDANKKTLLEQLQAKFKNSQTYGKSVDRVHSIA